MYSIYPVFAGKFWQYHWLIFYYFRYITELALFCGAGGGSEQIKTPFPRVRASAHNRSSYSYAGSVFAQFSPVGYHSWNPQNGRVGEIASYLKSHMKTGDTVQPLDFTGGALHAMLLAKSEIATPYPYDILFHYPVSSSYIQNLRKNFLQRLTEGNSRFIISIIGDRQWLSGPDTTREFEELETLIDSHYRKVLEGKGYILYERVPL